MKRIILVIIIFGLLTVYVLSFADDVQKISPKESAGQLVHDKSVFNHDQGIYNDKANKDIRDQQRVAQKTATNEQFNKKLQDQQDINKGQVIVKF